MKRTSKSWAFGVLFVGGLWFASPATALTGFPDPLTNAVAYGDWYSYSLPLLAYQYDALYGGGTGPGNPYYIPAGDGQIKDLTVLGTGGSGQPVNNNFAGADDAYALPDAGGAESYDDSRTFFSTKDDEEYNGTRTTVGPLAIGVEDPQETGSYFTPDFAGDSKDSWDIQLDVLKTQVLDPDGDNILDDMVIYFRNNQTNSGDSIDQNLYAWADFMLVDVEGIKPTLHFEFTNPTALGNDPANFLSDGVMANEWDSRPTHAGGDPGDAVLSGGDLTVCSDGSVLPAGLPCPGGTTVVTVLPHNLGVDQAAYALYSPELQTVLETANFGGYDVMQAYIRFWDLNNGPEAIWIRPGLITDRDEPPPVPEPGTMLLLGSGLIGLAGYGRRRKK